MFIGFQTNTDGKHKEASQRAIRMIHYPSWGHEEELKQATITEMSVFTAL